MKKFYILATTILLTATASAQTLAEILETGKSGETYTVTDKLQGVYVPKHHPNVIFVKDNNNYAGKSQPTEDQYNNHRLYDEKDGTMSAENVWTGTFDQSNWLKLVFPEGTDASVYKGKYFTESTITGMVNVQNAPCNPLGITMTVNEENAEWVDTDGEDSYVPNTYCVPNFSLQTEWYLVKPQNQEFAFIHWAVYNQADKKFYVPRKNVENGWNMGNLSGSVAIDMSLFEEDPGVNPDEVFTDGTSYDLYAMIEYRTGSQFTLNIDPGFGGDNNYHFAPSRPAGNDNVAAVADATAEADGVSQRRRTSTPNVEIGDGGEQPYVYDKDDNKYEFTVIVYPLWLDHPEIITGVEHNVGQLQAMRVRYCDLQGRVADTPHPGMNIVVTTWSDGTTTSNKLIK